MADVFVSYDSSDRAMAEMVARGLYAAGFSVWWDRDIQGGVDFTDEIDRQISAARVTIVLWSKASVISKWVRDEASTARDENKLIPVRIEAVQPPLGFRQLQALELDRWKGDPKAAAFTKLVTSIRHHVGDSTTDQTTIASRTSEPAPRRWIANKRLLAVSIAAIAVVAIALTYVVQRSGQTRIGEPADGRIAVDAFEPVAATNELERFSKGVTDAIVRVFATSDIKAVARSSAGEPNLASSPAEFMLHGTVDRDGDQIVVGAKLLHRREGLVLWSTTMRRDATQAGILEDEFSSSVASVLRCALRFRKAVNNDPSSDLFGRLLGICAAFVDGRSNEAPELARRFVEASPQYAFGYAVRAAANAIMSNSELSQVDAAPQEVTRLRRMVYDDARIAEEMDPAVDSYLARAIVDDPSVGFAARERLLQKSIEVDPGGSALNLYGRLLYRVGRVHDAVDYFQRAASANPLDWPSTNEAARSLGCIGNMDPARKLFDDLRRKHAHPYVDWMQFWTELWCGDPARAKTISETYTSFWSGWHLTDIGNEHPCGNTFLNARVRDLHPTLSEIDATCPDDPDMYGYFGYVDAALRVWESDQMPPLLRIMLFMPQNRLVRADPRFMQLAAQFGLVDYWLDTDQWPDFCKEDELPYDCRETALALRASNLKAHPISVDTTAG